MQIWGRDDLVDTDPHGWSAGRVLKLCLAILLLAVPIAAQSNPSTSQTADRLFAEANRLYREGTKDSLEQAIQKLLEAAAIYHSSGDAKHEAGALNNVARTYLLLRAAAGNRVPQTNLAAIA